MKNVRSSQAAILVLNWVKHSFYLRVSLKHALLFDICTRETCEQFAYKHSETIVYVKNWPTF